MAGMEEITPKVAELFAQVVITGSLGLMAMIFSIILGQLMYRLFED